MKMYKLFFFKMILFFPGALIVQTLQAKEIRSVGMTPAGQGNQSGEIAIHFPVNQSRLLRDFSGNATSLMLLDRLMNDRSFYFDIDSIVVNGYASPEGQILHNSRLSYERALAVKEHIVQNYPHVSSGKIVAVGRLVDMQAISDIVDNDLSVPFRNEARDVLARKELSDLDRLSLLKDVGGGAVIQHITQYYAASLRNATGIMFYRASDRITIVDTVVIKQPGDTIVINHPADTVIIKQPGDTVFVDHSDRFRKPLFALKTNLLFDIATAVNLELEIPLGKRWSVLGEYIFPWWLIENRQYALQVANANLETRVWFGDRSHRPHLTGWFAGLYAGGGYYDIEWGSKGYQGEFYISTGLTGGFAHTLGKKGNFRMEYSTGAGYFSTNYREYNPVFGSDDQWHLTRQKSGNYSWIGPTRFKISLVWLLHHNSYKPDHVKSLIK